MYSLLIHKDSEYRNSLRPNLFLLQFIINNQFYLIFLPAPPSPSFPLITTLASSHTTQATTPYTHYTSLTIMPLRQVSCKKLINPHFVGVIVFMTLNYFVFLYEFMIQIHPSYFVPAFLIFHIFFLLLLWSMVQSIISDPGRVPIYWGFFAQETDNRRRRYCLLCHSFKPERCHHCSTCQRCVLNMDHHCPWISNCVGYTNRKFFILFLFYIICTLLTALITCIPLVVSETIGLAKGTSAFTFHTGLRFIGILMQLSFFIVIVMFFKFHMQLVMTNSTTLDNLQRQRNPNVGNNVFNLGSYENFVQVFGTNTWMWPWPLFCGSMPKGDGVIWKKNQYANDSN